MREAYTNLTKPGVDYTLIEDVTQSSVAPLTNFLR
jgi:hypothetical protein